MTPSDWNWRTQLSVIATLVWIGVWFVINWHNWAEIKGSSPAEWGDLLAGITAPLAFLWLIAGYYLQSEELGNQITEMKEQKQVLELQRDAMFAQKDAMTQQACAMIKQAEFAEQNMRNMESRLSPILEVETHPLRGAFTAEGDAGVVIRFTNAGYPIKKLEIMSSVDGASCRVVGTEDDPSAWEVFFDNEIADGYGFPRYLKVSFYNGMNHFRQLHYVWKSERVDPEEHDDDFDDWNHSLVGMRTTYNQKSYLSNTIRVSPQSSGSPFNADEF